MIKRINRLRRSDEGAILVMALLVITTVALVTVALLTKGSGNLLATVQLRAVTGSAYSADAAAKLAINDLEMGSSSPNVALSSAVTQPWVFNNNVDGTGCFGASGTGASLTGISSVTYPSIYPVVPGGPLGSKATTATVTCSAVPGTGIFGTGAGGNDSGSGRALTILSSSSSALLVNPQGSGNGALFKIRGDIAVAGGLQVDHGLLFTTGKVTASPCPGASSVNADGPCTSSGGSVTDPLGGRDPDISAVPTNLGTWSGCVFQPGYYDDAQALTDATDDCPTATFAPGVYYFDFHNDSATTSGTPNDPLYSKYAMTGSGSNVWSISRTIIGGKVPGSSSNTPGRCVNPIDSPGNDGVQFVFGGDSRMSLGADSVVELCGSGNDTTPPIAIFELDGTTSARGSLPVGYAAAQKFAPTIAAGTVTSSKTGNVPDFAPTPANVSDSDSLANDDAKLETFASAAGTKTVMLTLKDFPSTGIPPGSLLTGAKILVKHQEATVGTAGNPTIAPSVKVSVGTAVNRPLTTGLTNTSTTATPNALKLDTLDLEQDATLMTALGKAVHSGDLSSLVATFSEAAKGNTNASVGSFQLQLTYNKPAFRGQTTTAVKSNCVSSQTCNFVVTGNGSSYKGAFVIQGATYIPNAKIDMSLGNQTQTVAFRWGLVANAATLGSLNNFPFAYPVVSIPGSGPGFGAAVTAVDLKVYTCAASGTSACPTTGDPALTARVAITDPVSATTGLVTPAPGTRKIQVLSWAEQR